MTIILGFGTEGDPQALPLFTRRRSFIRNVQRDQLPSEVIEARIQANLRIDPRIQVLSCATTYNCYGLVFASRRTCIIGPEDIPSILQDDGYRRLPWDAAAWRPGDLALYGDGSGEITHVGKIVRVEHDLLGGDPAVWVISAWGETGEYLHPVEAVSSWLGRPFRVVSQRLSYDS